MKFFVKKLNQYRVQTGYSIFETGDGTKEMHVMMQPFECTENFEKQLKSVDSALREIARSEGFSESEIFFKRYFLSDAANQYPSLMEFEGNQCNYAVSAIQQPSLGGGKVALWAYLAQGLTVVKQEDKVIASHNGYSHIWHVQLHGQGNNSSEQTRGIVERLVHSMDSEKLSLKEHCVRTWFFVHNVDVNYQDMVATRKKLFENMDMTPETHYIASTGIEGRNNNPRVSVIADAYSVGGTKQGQVSFLNAPTHMNPTYEYGVTFERGTSVSYGDRKHIFISGTASINNKGEIMFPNDIMKQTERTVENVKALLEGSNASLSDIAQLIVYLRDASDYQSVNNYFNVNYPEIPKIIVLAPVCRPGWLIEMEGIAIIGQQKEQFHNF